MAEQLSWLDGIGFDGIELSAAALDLPPRELEEIFADSPVRPANIAGSGALLDPDPAERAAAKISSSSRGGRSKAAADNSMPSKPDAIEPR